MFVLFQRPVSSFKTGVCQPTSLLQFPPPPSWRVSSPYPQPALIHRIITHNLGEVLGALAHAPLQHLLTRTCTNSKVWKHMAAGNYRILP